MYESHDGEDNRGFGFLHVGVRVDKNGVVEVQYILQYGTAIDSLKFKENSKTSHLHLVTVI